MLGINYELIYGETIYGIILFHVELQDVVERILIFAFGLLADDDISFWCRYN